MVNFCKCCDAHMFFVVDEIIEAVSKDKDKCIFQLNVWSIAY